MFKLFQNLINDIQSRSFGILKNFFGILQHRLEVGKRNIKPLGVYVN